MNDFLSYAMLGIPIGCVFALLAVGIVLTYKTSGVFNLAFGAQAFVSAAVFYDTVSRHDWPPVLGFLVAVVVAGPVIGLLLDQALYRHLRTAPAVAKLVTSLGLLVAIPQIVKLCFGTSPAYNPPRPHPVGRGVLLRPVRARREPDRHHRRRPSSWSSASASCSGARTSACRCGPSSRAPA